MNVKAHDLVSVCLPAATLGRDRRPTLGREDEIREKPMPQF